MGETCSFDSLPVETMEEIFLHYLSGFSRPFSPDIQQGPLLLCKISTLWREVAIGIPFIWDNLKITDGSALKPQRRPTVEFVKTWFERAGQQRLLSLAVVGHTSIPDSQNEKYCEDLWSFIQCYAHRFRAIAVDDPNLCDKLLRATLFDLPLVFKHLETLHLRRCGKATWEDVCVRRCQPPETLRRMFLRTTSSLERMQSPILGWDHLTHLDTVTPYSIESCLEQLRVLPHLVSCHIYLSRGLQPQTLAPVILPSLQHLNLDFDFGGTRTTVNNLQFLSTHIQSLSATLSSLRLNCLTRAQEPRLHPHYIAPHLGKSLTKLSFIFLSINFGNLVAILLCCPRVTELLLQLDRVQQESIALMLTRDATNVQFLQLLPFLTHLTLYIYVKLEEQYDPKLHANMILSRRAEYYNDQLPLYTHLKAAVLLHRGSGDSIQPGIDSLREILEEETHRGLKLHIFDPTVHTYPQDHRLSLTPEKWIYDTAS